MEYIAPFIGTVFLFAVLIALGMMRRIEIYEFQRGLLYASGKFVKVLEPGLHWYNRFFQTARLLDVRLVNVSIPGQEVLTADNVGIKISLAAVYRVSDPYKAVNLVASYHDALYLLLQLNARDIIGGLEVDDLLAQRGQIGQALLERSAPLAVEFGIDLQVVNLKDIMFPGELKNIFAQVVNARKEGQATLERARGETAALRSMLNGAQLFKEHPQLWQLRLLQTLENSSGNTVVMLPPNGLPGLLTGDQS